MKTILSLAILACMGGTAASAGEASHKSDVVAFNASVRVDVDAAGKPVKVEAPADLPDAIRGYIEKRVASWQYLPAQVDGLPQPAITYVDVNACAVPVAEGYRLGLDFNGNGIRFASGTRLPPLAYPPAAQRAGTEAEFTLILDVAEDGRAQIGAIEQVDISGRAGASEFEPLLRRWARTLRFDMEHVAGKPVATRARMPVTFSLRDFGNRRALREELQAKAKASRECQVASGAQGPDPIVLQPAVTVIPQPAG